MTSASWLLLGVASFAAVDTTTAALSLRHFNQGAGAYLATAGNGEQVLRGLAELHGDFVYDTALAASSGVLFGLLGVLIRWPSRIIRFITCFLATTMSVALIVGYAASPENVLSGDVNQPEQIRRAAANLLLPWYPSWQSAAASVEIVALIAAVVLLLTQNSGDYYRKLQIDGRAGLWSFLPDASDRP